MKGLVWSIVTLIFMNNPIPKGTLLINCITQYGIVIAADSRGCFYDEVDGIKMPIATFDSALKIFKLNNYILSIAGANGIGETYFSTIIGQFNETYNQKTGVESVLSEFIHYLDTHFPLTQFPERRSNKFLLAGYENDLPVMLSFSTAEGIRNHKGTVTSESGAGKYYNHYNSMPQLSVVDVIESTIYSYAREEKMEHLVGGPIAVLLIKPGNELQWIKNDFSTRVYENPSAFFERVREESVKIEYLIPDGKQRLFKIFGY